MHKYLLEIVLVSDALVGSGEGFGTGIDTDIVFDDLGIPYIPARRIKGCLRESYNEACNLINGLNSTIPEFQNLKLDIENTLFGNRKLSDTNAKESSLIFHNLTISEYESNRAWLNYIVNNEHHSKILQPELITSLLTSNRTNIQIDENTGSTKHNSLRTIRVLNQGLKFYGELYLSDKVYEESILFACLNFKSFGTKRNRGLGEIECNLYSFSEERQGLNINLTAKFQERLKQYA